MSGFRRRNQRARSAEPFDSAEPSEPAGPFGPPPPFDPPAPFEAGSRESGAFDPTAFDPPAPYDPSAPLDPPTPFEAAAHRAAGTLDQLEQATPFDAFGTAAPVEPLEVVEPAGESPELVRPYVITNGRGLPGNDRFNLITLVTAADRPRPAHFDPEKHRLLDLCGGGMLSVAEIAGHIKLPIGIVKVLLSDLSTEGYLVVRPPVPRAQLADVSLLQEVLDGLQARFG
jgi:hypothetical protein